MAGACLRAQPCQPGSSRPSPCGRPGFSGTRRGGFGSSGHFRMPGFPSMGGTLTWPLCGNERHFAWGTIWLWGRVSHERHACIHQPPEPPTSKGSRTPARATTPPPQVTETTSRSSSSDVECVELCSQQEARGGSQWWVEDTEPGPQVWKSSAGLELRPGEPPPLQRSWPTSPLGEAPRSRSCLSRLVWRRALALLCFSEVPDALPRPAVL